MTSSSLDRRTVILGGGATGLLAFLGSGVREAAALARQPTIIPRSEWGADLPATGAIPAEDVRFLLVHHTFQPDSSYEMDEVPQVLRSIYGFHTGASKGWPDIAYNFFVDRFGRIWEGRTGSIAGPVQGSATGGNQGYSQLCCFLGDTTHVPPTDAALASMIALLAWLADRYGVSTEPGAQVTFTSRGSNRWSEGTPVTTSTIAGHRDMSLTECPGDACYELVTTSFSPLVSDVRGVAARTTTTTTAATTASIAPPSTTSAPTTLATDDADRAETSSTPEAVPTEKKNSSSWPELALAGAAAVGGAFALGVLLHRRRFAEAWDEMEVDVEVPDGSVAVGQIDLIDGGAVWCIGRAWNESSIVTAERLIAAGVRDARRSTGDQLTESWTNMAAELLRLGPPTVPDAAAGIVVAHWFRSRLDLVLLGEASGRVQGARGHDLRPRSVNTERLDASETRVELELGEGSGHVEIEWTVASSQTSSRSRLMEMEDH